MLLQQQQIGVGINDSKPPLSHIGGGYQPYILKPAKLKTITKPTLGPSQGVSQDRSASLGGAGKYGGGSSILNAEKVVTSDSPML